MRKAWSLVVALSRITVSIMLAGAAIGKLLDVRVESAGLLSGVGAFERELLGQGIIPASAAWTLAIGVVATELALAALGLAHRAPRVWSWACIALLAAFSLYLIALAARGTLPNCPCFGVFGGSSLRSALVRNALLSLLASLSLAAVASGSPSARRRGVLSTHARA